MILFNIDNLYNGKFIDYIIEEAIRLKDKEDSDLTVALGVCEILSEVSDKKMYELYVNAIREEFKRRNKNE